MRMIRATVRLLLVTLVTTVIYWLLCAGSGLQRRHPERRIAHRNRCLKAWGRLFARLIGMRIVVQGEPPVAPSVIVCNHLSYVDMVALGAQVGVRFIAKSDVADWPLVGKAVAGAETIFVDRNSARDAIRVNHLIRDTLAAGDSILFFPEGTSSGGEDVLPLKSALLHYCTHAQVPVHVATVSYTTPDVEPHPSEAVCWWGEMPFFSHVFKLLGMRKFDAHITFSSEPIRGTDRKKLAADLRDAMRGQFTPVAHEKARLST